VRNGWREVKAEDSTAVGMHAESIDLLERSEHLAVLGDTLATVAGSGQGRLVFVRGEAGVGKTEVVRRFCEQQHSSARILWGACNALFTPRALGPFVDVARVTGGELGELVERGGRPHEVLSALVGVLGERSPAVLVLDDLHWADEATLDVLRLLGRRLDQVCALVIAMYRDDELGREHPLRVVLGELTSGRGIHRLGLLPLSPAAVCELAEPYRLDGAELHRWTGGNPFFVAEVLGARGEKIPETVRDAVLARAARLSAPARRLLEAVAVIPGQVELWLLEMLAAELLDRLEECLASGMLSPGPAHVAFRHELARLAVAESLAPDRRLSLHRAALAALETREGYDLDFARLAHHAEAAGDAEAVLRWAPRAAERAASSGAHREAAAQHARALRFADRLSLPRRAELLQRRADECYMTDQFAHAIEAQQAALDCQRRLGDRRGEGNSLRSQSLLLHHVGRTQDAWATAMNAVELLEPMGPGRELALSYCNISHLCMDSEDADGTLRWGTRALELARRLDDTEALVYALTNLAVVDFWAGEDEAQVPLERALELARQHGLEEPAGRILANLVLWSVRHRMFAVATAHLEAGLEYCSERGLDTWRLYLLACRARLELDLGRWDEAADSAALVLRDPRSAPVPRGWALAAVRLVRARRGDPDPSAPLDDAGALAQATRELSRIAPVAAARAEAAWLTGDNATVEQVTDAALALARDCRAPWVAGELAYWRWQAGMRDELPAAAVAEPYRLSMAGDWAQAAELWTKIGCPYEAALALAESDDQLAMRQAIDQLEQLGARPGAAIIARRHRKRGARGVPRGPRARTQDNPSGLTARELEVLALLADGLRNAQIAARLVVSEKTVHHHVSAILHKLHVHTRHEAAAEAVRLGLTPSTPGSAAAPQAKLAPTAVRHA
jgi:ATP/maltotriose-dependent transcriptional regulator MalT